jgi:hypothetical protein
VEEVAERILLGFTVLSEMVLFAKNTVDEM